MDLGNYRFSSNHLWVLREGKNAKIGISYHAQEQLGSIMFLNLPKVGSKVQIGETFGDIEGVKTVSEMISPVSGSVLRINESLTEEPEKLNDSPYEEFLIEVEVSEASEELMEKDAYFKFITE